MPKYGGFSGPYFPVFGLNTRKYGPRKFRIWHIFYAVIIANINQVASQKYKSMSKVQISKGHDYVILYLSCVFCFNITHA